MISPRPVPPSDACTHVKTRRTVNIHSQYLRTPHSWAFSCSRIVPSWRDWPPLYRSEPFGDPSFFFTATPSPITSTGYDLTGAQPISLELVWVLRVGVSSSYALMELAISSMQMYANISLYRVSFDSILSQNTNIVRFCSALKKDDASQQMVYYQVRPLSCF